EGLGEMSKKKNKNNVMPKEEVLTNQQKLYISYLKDNVELFIQMLLEKSNDFEEKNRIEILKQIASFTKGKLVHYELEHDSYCTWDHSGYLEEDGYISNDITVKEFLENEYTGRWVATYISGHGMHYTDYKESFEEELSESLNNFKMKNIKNKLNEYFGVNISDAEFNDLYFEAEIDDKLCYCDELDELQFVDNILTHEDFGMTLEEVIKVYG
ncbi:MAG: hypothetical protein K6G26_04400, partial [Lachnospiraceae bacterium]|nr:hypothetical protein [Lachnospiraceae bacterium]